MAASTREFAAEQTKKAGKTHLEATLDELVLNLSWQAVGHTVSMLSFLTRNSFVLPVETDTVGTQVEGRQESALQARDRNRRQGALGVQAGSCVLCSHVSDFLSVSGLWYRDGG